MDCCLLGKLICRRPVLPSAAPPPRRELRPDSLVEGPFFGFDSSCTHDNTLLYISSTNYDNMNSTHSKKPSNLIQRNYMGALGRVCAQQDGRAER